MADLAFKFAERRPHPALLPWIRNYWAFEVSATAPPIHHVPPDGCTALVINVAPGGAGPVILSGPWLEPLAVPVTAGARSIGIRLQPGAAFEVLGLRAAELRNRAQIGDHLLGGLAVKLREATAAAVQLNDVALEFDRILVEAAKGWQMPDAVVASGIERLVATGGEIAIPDLAREVSVSERTLRRRFGVATGYSPKQFARIRRLLEAASQALNDDVATWSQLAAAAGYADQPHLSRDFVDLTGLTPKQFEARMRTTEHDEVNP